MTKLEGRKESCLLENGWEAVSWLRRSNHLVYGCGGYRESGRTSDTNTRHNDPWVRKTGRNNGDKLLLGKKPGRPFSRLIVFFGWTLGQGR